MLERDSSALSQRDAAEGLLRGGLAPEEVGEAVRRTGARVVHAHNVNPTLGWRALAAAREAGRARGAAPPQLPARVRGRDLLHPRGGLHALPRAQHAAGRAAQLPRRLAGRVGRLRRLAGAVAGPDRGAGRSLPRPQRVRAAAAAGAGRAGRRPRARAVVGPARVRERLAGRARAATSSTPGRLSHEKGVADAVIACRDAGLPLVVAGDGPAADELRELAAGADVQFTGRVGPEALAELRRDAAVAVVPVALRGDPAARRARGDGGGRAGRRGTLGRSRRARAGGGPVSAGRRRRARSAPAPAVGRRRGGRAGARRGARALRARRRSRGRSPRSTPRTTKGAQPGRPSHQSIASSD